MVQCVLLNADWLPLGIIPWRKAVRLIVKQKAEVIKVSEKVIRNFDNTVTIVIPTVLKLIKMIRVLYGKHVPLNKRNVKILYGGKCAYCGETADPITLDHVIPVSRGGKSSYDNLVIACSKCNSRKDNRTPREAGLSLKYKPYRPTIAEFIRIHLKNMGLDRMLKDLGIL